jgi:glycosyltransferase involved in cell wall biosynthesis
VHVAIVSRHPLPVRGYGGTQRIVAALVRGLAALGHRVTLLAPRGTRMPEATWVEVPARRLREPTIDFAPFLPADADVVHAHFPVHRVPPGVPFLQTLYGNLPAGYQVPPHNVFLSRNHARRYGGEVFVYAGLDPAEFTFRAAKQDYDLFLGRLHSVKGYRWAIEGAKRTGRRLILAGGWRPSFRRNIRFVGEVDGQRKRELLAGARCLWMPALWDEPFGLTLIEPLFSGTPVLGTRRGSLPEILNAEVGALCDTLEEMIAAAETIGTRSAEACRAHAERHFTHLVMAQEYVRMYRGLRDTGSLPPGKPTPYTSS